MSAGSLKVCVVTNIATPYRIPVYELLAQRPGIDLEVLYFADREPDRSWRLPHSSVSAETLRSWVLTVRGRHIHFTWGVMRGLRARRPDVVITTGYNPGHLAAFLYARLAGVAHVVQTDGSVESEKCLTWLHRSLRRLIVRRSQSAVAASKSGMDLLVSYGAQAENVHISPLAVDNASFAAGGAERNLDLLVVGRLVPIKNPGFAVEVAAAVSERLGRVVSLDFVGDGDLEEDVRKAAQDLTQVQLTMSGFQHGSDLAVKYASARVFLFPTLWDPWGLVVNEALAAGIPAIISPHAGAKELIEDGRSGYVRPLDVGLWADLAAELISDGEKWDRFSLSAVGAVANYTFTAAADGLEFAVRQATS